MPESVMDTIREKRKEIMGTFRRTRESFVGTMEMAVDDIRGVIGLQGDEEKEKQGIIDIIRKRKEKFMKRISGEEEEGEEEEGGATETTGYDYVDVGLKEEESVRSLTDEYEEEKYRSV